MTVIRKHKATLIRPSDNFVSRNRTIQKTPDRNSQEFFIAQYKEDISVIGAVSIKYKSLV